MASEIDRLRKACDASKSDWAKRRDEVEAAVSAAMAARDAFYLTQETAEDEYVRARDQAKRRAWEMRSPLVDRLRAQALEEAGSLAPQALRIPGEDQRAEAMRRGMGGGVGIMITDAVVQEMHDRYDARVVSNAASVNARAAALRALASGCEMLTQLLRDDDDLERWYGEEYARLPRVEPIREVLLRDPRGKLFAGRFPANAA